MASEEQSKDTASEAIYRELKETEEALARVVSRIGQFDPSHEPRLFAAVKSLEGKIGQIKQAIERLKK